MDTKTPQKEPRILIFGTLSGGYKGADGVGQMHADYPPNTYILPVVCPSMFDADFYLRAFERGIDAVVIMFSGSDCPYKGGADRTAEIVNQAYVKMKERAIDVRRLRLAAICTVCTAPFQREIIRIEEILAEIGPIQHPLPPIQERVVEPA